MAYQQDPNTWGYVDAHGDISAAYGGTTEEETAIPSEITQQLYSMHNEMAELRDAINETRTTLIAERDAHQSEVQTLRSVIADLDARLRKVEQRPVTPAASTPSGVPAWNASPLKLPMPDKYDGTNKPAAHVFISALANIFEVQHVPNERFKLITAQALLTGVAHEWCTAELQSNGNTATEWSAWSKAFLRRFGERDREGDAAREISELRQGAMTLGDFVTKFKGLRSRLAEGERNSIFIFTSLWQGLNRNVQTALARDRDTFARDHDPVSCLVAELDRYEHGLSMVTAPPYHTQQARNTPATPANQHRAPQPKVVIPPRAAPLASAPTAPTPASTSAPPARRDPEAMDIDRARKKKVQCYNCFDLGHIAIDCPKPVNRKRAKAAAIARGEEVADSDTESVSGKV